jgi:hypothetical protein
MSNSGKPELEGRGEEIAPYFFFTTSR